MALVVFAAFIAVYAVLVAANRSCDPRAYKLFFFGLLISVLYAAVFSLYSDIYLLFILLLTSLAILTQYIHWRAVDAGRTKPMKNVVNITTPAEKVLLSSKNAKMKSRPARKTRSKRK